MPSRLATATSPYLRAHADNPVRWYPWGEDAFAEAKRRDVPVLVSIGYSTCHWCHVMARESFSDAATAEIINDGFVAIKVDREEHPEVDATYLTAAGAFTRSLGWPLTVFTTPDGRAFFAGTYWPPEPRPPMAAFSEVLAAVREAWTERRTDVEGTSRRLAETLAELGATAAKDSPLPSPVDLAAAASLIAASEDGEFGGFAAPGSGMDTPKFPTVPALRFLQATVLSGGSGDVATRAMRAMASSELRDPVEGGFFRYATRRDWTVPHFERMLTDNAGLLDVAVDAGDHTTARGIAQFLMNVMQLPSGGFAAAQDSESVIDKKRSEGGYYERDASGRAGLVPPALDEKVVTGWNGMAIAALARAGVRVNEPRWIDAAARAADAVLAANIDEDGMLVRASLDGVRSSARAVLEDWGLLAEGLLALAVASGRACYGARALQLIDACVDGSTVRAPGGGDSVLRAQSLSAPADASDGDHPSGPASVGAAAVAAWTLGAGEKYREIATGIVASAADAALAQPMGYGGVLRVAGAMVSAPRQVVVIADEPSAPMAAAARQMRVDLLAVVTGAQARDLAAAGFSLFGDKRAVGGAATLYDCRDFSCRLPVTDPGEIAG